MRTEQRERAAEKIAGECPERPAKQEADDRDQDMPCLMSDFDEYDELVAADHSLDGRRRSVTARSYIPEPVFGLLTGIVDRFWLRTESLAVQNAQLQCQHTRVEADAAALRSAVHFTESGVQQLAQHQNFTASQIRGELQETRDALHQHLLAIAQDQSLAYKHVDNRLREAQQAFEIAQQEALSAKTIAANQAHAARVVTEELSSVLNDSLAGFSSRVSELERRLAESRLQDQAQRVVGGTRVLAQRTTINLKNESKKRWCTPI